MQFKITTISLHVCYKVSPSLTIPVVIAIFCCGLSNVTDFLERIKRGPEDLSGTGTYTGANFCCATIVVAQLDLCKPGICSALE